MKIPFDNTGQLKDVTFLTKHYNTYQALQRAQSNSLIKKAREQENENDNLNASIQYILLNTLLFLCQ